MSRHKPNVITDKSKVVGLSICRQKCVGYYQFKRRVFANKFPQSFSTSSAKSLCLACIFPKRTNDSRVAGICCVTQIFGESYGVRKVLVSKALVNLHLHCYQLRLVFTALVLKI